MGSRSSRLPSAPPVRYAITFLAAKQDVGPLPPHHVDGEDLQSPRATPVPPAQAAPNPRQGSSIRLTPTACTYADPPSTQMMI